MSKVYHRETRVFIPYLDENNSRNYVSMCFRGSVCLKRILREVRKMWKQTYGRSYNKAMFKYAGICNYYDAPAGSNAVERGDGSAFYTWLQKMIDEEKERRANQDNGDTTLQTDDTRTTAV